MRLVAPVQDVEAVLCERVRETDYRLDCWVHLHGGDVEAFPAMEGLVAERPDRVVQSEEGLDVSYPILGPWAECGLLEDVPRALGCQPMVPKAVLRVRD